MGPASPSPSRSPPEEWEAPWVAGRDQTTVEPDDIELPLGWLSPDGRWYSCAHAGHDSLAMRIRPDRAVPERVLEDEGWVKVLDMPIRYGEGARAVWCNQKPTEAQTEVIRRWVEKHQKDGKFYDGLIAPLVDFRGWLALIRERC